jgi:hypothetical protein
MAQTAVSARMRAMRRLLPLQLGLHLPLPAQLLRLLQSPQRAQLLRQPLLNQ